MEFKELDLLSEKVAKALYLIKNLQAEKLSLTQKLEALKAENEALVKKVGEKESKISAASKRLEGMLDSLKILDGATSSSSQADLFGSESNSQEDEENSEEVAEEIAPESENEAISAELSADENLEHSNEELENTQEEPEFSTENEQQDNSHSEENSEEELPY